MWHKGHETFEMFACNLLIVCPSSFSYLLVEQVYDNLFLLFSKCFCLQLLLSNFCNSSFLISHLLTVFFFYLLFFDPTSFLPHSNLSCRNTWLIHLCLQHHIMFNVFIYYIHTVWVKKIPPWNFLTFFPKRLGIFSPNFTHPLYVPIYAELQIFIQLPATLMKSCNIKREHHNVLKMSTIDRNARWVVALNMA